MLNCFLYYWNYYCFSTLSSNVLCNPYKNSVWNPGEEKKTPNIYFSQKLFSALAQSLPTFLQKADCPHLCDQDFSFHLHTCSLALSFPLGQALLLQGKWTSQNFRPFLEVSDTPSTSRSTHFFPYSRSICFPQKTEQDAVWFHHFAIPSPSPLLAWKVEVWVLEHLFYGNMKFSFTILSLEQSSATE